MRQKVLASVSDAKFQIDKIRFKVKSRKLLIVRVLRGSGGVLPTSIGAFAGFQLKMIQISSQSACFSLIFQFTMVNTPM
jgi:hypothetical protein